MTKLSKKIYVLDTNVLLYDPESIFRFEDNDVVIPIFVIEEVDKFKREQTDRGKGARAVCRHLDTLRDNGGSLKEGVTLPGGGTLRILVPLGKPTLYSAFDRDSMDQAILQTALVIKSDHPECRVVFVTMDTNLRVRSDAYGLETQTYESRRVNIESVTGSVLELDTDPTTLNDFFSSPEGMPFSEWDQVDPATFTENASVLLKSTQNPNQTGLGRVVRGKIRKLRIPSEKLLGLRPKNREQSYALDLLLDPEVHIVTLLGTAGSGKTLLAILAGLDQLIKGRYERIVITRPMVPLGRDIGYLPGSSDEKLDPWMQPIYDNLSHILKEGKVTETMDQLKEREALKMEPLTFIRGRSLARQFIMADEFQNASIHEAKTLISRCGEGTKIVLTGDPFQIDNPYVDSTTNGLSVVSHKLKGQPLAGHVALMKGERSPLAELATKYLLKGVGGGYHEKRAGILKSVETLLTKFNDDRS